MYYKATQYEKFKFNLGNLSPVQLQLIVLVISFITGNIIRYNLLRDTIIYYQSQSFILYILTDIVLIILMAPIGFCIGVLSRKYHITCENFKYSFSKFYERHMEWDSLGMRKNKDIKGEISNGDLLGIKLVDNFLKDSNARIDFNIYSPEDLLSYIKKDNYPYSLKQYIILHTNIDKSADFAIDSMERYLSNKYYINKSRERLCFYWEELIAKACHPKRVMTSCVGGNYLDNSSDDEI